MPRKKKGLLPPREFLDPEDVIPGSIVAHVDSLPILNLTKREIAASQNGEKLLGKHIRLIDFLVFCNRDKRAAKNCLNILKLWEGSAGPDGSWLGAEQIIEESNLSKNTVYKYLKKLVHCKVLHVVRGKDKRKALRDVSYDHARFYFVPNSYDMVFVQLVLERLFLEESGD